MARPSRGELRWMTMVTPRALVLLAVVAACGGSPPTALPAPSPPPVPVDATVVTAVDATVALAPDAPPAPPAPGMISDEDCVKQGGHVETSFPTSHDADAPPNRPPVRVCRVPSPMNGHSCRDESDCQGGRCFCTGALRRPNPGDDPKLQPLDHTPGTGVCLEQTLPSGSWFCLVVGGEIRLQGIIID